MLNLNDKKFRFEATTFRSIRALTLIFLCSGLFAARADTLAEKMLAAAIRDRSAITKIAGRPGFDFRSHELLFPNAAPIVADSADRQIFWAADDKTQKGNKGKNGSTGNSNNIRGSTKGNNKKKKTSNAGQRAEAKWQEQSRVATEKAYKIFSKFFKISAA